MKNRFFVARYTGILCNIGVRLQTKSQAEIDESMYFFIQTVLLLQKPDHLVLVWNA